jgi:thiamine kinase-like enzyme
VHWQHLRQLILKTLVYQPLDHPQTTFPGRSSPYHVSLLPRRKLLILITGKTTGKIPYFDELVDWYTQHLPDETKTGQRIVHGDYKLDNLIFHPVDNRVIGVLDWELCTLGSPVSSCE